MRDAILVVMVVVACGGSQAPAQSQPAPISNTAAKTDPPPAAPAVAVDPYSVEGAIAMMDEYRSKMCACRDQACAQHVVDAMTAWGREASKHDGNDLKPTEAQVRRISGLTKDLTDCMAKLMSAPGSGSGTGP
jgi:hypothetical protein